jgi:hypothetical protein
MPPPLVLTSGHFSTVLVTAIRVNRKATHDLCCLDHELCSGYMQHAWERELQEQNRPSCMTWIAEYCRPFRMISGWRTGPIRPLPGTWEYHTMNWAVDGTTNGRQCHPPYGSQTRFCQTGILQYTCGCQCCPNLVGQAARTTGAFPEVTHSYDLTTTQTSDST